MDGQDKWEHRPPCVEKLVSEEPTSCKLQKLGIDEITGFLIVPIYSLLSFSVTQLCFYSCHAVERFTKEQEDALQPLTSLQDFSFFKLDKLQCLQAGLHRLSNLKTLWIEHCQAFQSLPKDGLPSSLQALRIGHCEALKLMPKDGLPNSLKNLEIYDCPALKLLPKLPSSLQDLTICDCPALKLLPNDGLPNSLRVLNVQRGGNSEELMRQCRKLKGTIPIIKD